MRIVVALGGNALLERGEPPESDIQEAHIVTAVRPIATAHDLVITHGQPWSGTAKPAAIGRLADAEALLAGQAGTLICPA